MSNQSLATPQYFTGQKVRFCVGDPQGGTSNQFKSVASPKGDLYIICTDLMGKKVSLHASGQCHLRLVDELRRTRPELWPPGFNGITWKWPMPAPIAPGLTIPFCLYFLRSELRIQPQQRDPRLWQKSVFVSPAPPGRVTRITLAYVDPATKLRGGPESALFAVQKPGNRSACWIADWPQDLGISAMLRRGLDDLRTRMLASGLPDPQGTWTHAYGTDGAGVPSIVAGQV